MTSRRIPRALLCAAALGALGVSTANGSLSIDLRAVTRNGVAVSDPKTVNVAVGDTVVFRVFADVTGLDDSKPDCLQLLSGSFLSTGGIKGTLALTTGGLLAPFDVFPYTTGGHQSDLDGDGDLDLGSNNDADPTGFFAIVADRMTGPRSTRLDGVSAFPPGFEPTAIPHGTEYSIVRTMRMFVTDIGGPTLVNFRRRDSVTGGFWAEDANEIATDNGDGTTTYTYSGGTTFSNTSSVIGNGVTLIAVPEPATLGLASIAGLGLLSQRRASAPLARKEVSCRA
jgi:hypothetical protein